LTIQIKTALIVDDDPILCALAESFFRGRGAVEVQTAANGKEALDFLHENAKRIDFILIDLNMPEIDGVQFLRYLEKSGYEGPFAILSGEQSAVLKTAQSLAKSYNLNMLGALAKPFDPNALNALIDNAADLDAQAPVPAPARITPYDLSAALRAGQVVPYYQPKVDVISGRITGAEALARWIDPKDGGVIGPDAFIPVAEQYDMIRELTEKMLADIAVDLRHWRKHGLDLKVSVNLSAKLLGDLTFPEQAVARMADNGLEHSRLVFEITESQIVEKRAEAMEVMARLRILGFDISIDDFGTGYSNLESLREFPFCELKIDKSFVQAALTDPFARTCVEASVALARKLDLKVVAEGVETGEDWNYIASLGIDEVQGYYVAKPVAAAEFQAWCAEGEYAAPDAPATRVAG